MPDIILWFSLATVTGCIALVIAAIVASRKEERRLVHITNFTRAFMRDLRLRMQHTVFRAQTGGEAQRMSDVLDHYDNAVLVSLVATFARDAQALPKAATAVRSGAAGGRVAKPIYTWKIAHARMKEAAPSVPRW